jgi:hypothetical protein
VTVRQVRLVFDDSQDTNLSNSGRHRAESRVFPSLVRDYRLEARVGGRWRTLARVEGNRRRQRIHDVGSVETDAIRVEVTATNGVAQARVVAVRVY